MWVSGGGRANGPTWKNRKRAYPAFNEKFIKYGKELSENSMSLCTTQQGKQQGYRRMSTMHKGGAQQIGL
jgi:hypothetical protein